MVILDNCWLFDIWDWLIESKLLMDSNQNTVYYCSVSKDGQVLYSHSVGDQEIENLAALCLDKTPTYHKCYFQTMGKKTYGFLIEDEHVYFAIADKGLHNFGVLQFLKHVRDEFKHLSSKKGLKKSKSNTSSLSVQEQLVPVIHRLITSLEQVSQNNNDWQPEGSSGLSPSLSTDSNGEVVASTKAPLLSKSSMKEKKKNKDHVIGMRGIEIEEHRSSTDRVGKNEINISDSMSSLNKEVGYVRTRSINGSSSSRSVRKKWCRLVRIVLAIDIAVCLVSLAVWLVICGGVKCLH